MGMFSWNCKVCGHPMLSPEATEEYNKWMSRVVILNPDAMIRGEYDGYGNCGDYEYNGCGEPEVYHEACWELAGKPTEFTSPSEQARDQGYFFDDNVHNVHEPITNADIQNIKISGKLAQENCQKEWHIIHLEFLLGKAHEALGENAEEETKKRALEDIVRHIEHRNLKEKQEAAAKLEINIDEYTELENYVKKVSEKDHVCPIDLYKKAQKLENGMFRITTHQDIVADYDLENDKVYMVEDPYGAIQAGTERDSWLETY